MGEADKKPTGTTAAADYITLALDALVEAEWPEYVVRSFLESGAMSDVEHTLATLRPRGLFGITYEEVLPVVEQSLAAYATGGLSTSSGGQAQGGEARGTYREGSLFPPLGDTESFPRPKACTPPSTGSRAPDKGGMHPPLDTDSLRLSAALLRVEAQVRQWRRGRVSPEDAVSAISAAVSNLESKKIIANREYCTSKSQPLVLP